MAGVEETLKEILELREAAAKRQVEAERDRLARVEAHKEVRDQTPPSIWQTNR
mgnify:CR=1 FL=1